MERRDRLYENYEDALFSLLMDQVAEEEGARLFAENERLKNDPDAEVPESFDRRSRETIRRAFSGRRQRSATRRFGRVLSRLAVAVLVALLMFGSAYALFPSVRIRTLNLLIEHSNVASRLSVVKDDEDSGTPFSETDTLMGYTLPALTDKYTVIDKEEDRYSGWIKYKHTSGSMIRIDITQGNATYLDTENIDFSEDIKVHSFSGTLVEKGDTITVSWNDTDNGNLILLTCVNSDKALALTYADEIIYVG